MHTCTGARSQCSCATGGVQVLRALLMLTCRVHATHLRILGELATFCRQVQRQNLAYKWVVYRRLPAFHLDRELDLGRPLRPSELEHFRDDRGVGCVVSAGGALARRGGVGRVEGRFVPHPHVKVPCPLWHWAVDIISKGAAIDAFAVVLLCRPGLHFEATCVLNRVGAFRAIGRLRRATKAAARLLRGAVGLATHGPGGAEGRGEEHDQGQRMAPHCAASARAELELALWTSLQRARSRAVARRSKSSVKNIMDEPRVSTPAPAWHCQRHERATRTDQVLHMRDFDYKQRHVPTHCDVICR
jgi:hypothetical protein